MSLIGNIGIGYIKCAEDFLKRNCPLKIQPKLKYNQDSKTIDVEGDLVLSATDEPSEIGWRFNHVKGNLSCAHSQVNHMSGFPSEVDGYFDISFSKITSLEYCPTKVGGDFICAGLGFTEEQVRGACPNIGGKIYC